MHPNVRMMVFLVFAGFLAAGGSGRLWAALMLLIVAYTAAAAPALSGLGRALLRLRYLWLSLALLYLWFTPGESVWPQLGAWSPTWEGAAQGAVRVGVLVLMVAAAQLLLQTTNTDQLVAAVYWLVGPLQWFGLDRGRFALRLVLVLETVPRLANAPTESAPAEPPRGERFARHVAVLERRLEVALRSADASGVREVILPSTAAPPIWQWLYPLAVAVLMGAAGAL